VHDDGLEAVVADVLPQSLVLLAVLGAANHVDVGLGLGVGVVLPSVRL